MMQGKFVGIRVLLTLITILLPACNTLQKKDQIAGQCAMGDMTYIPAGWFIIGENDGRDSNQPQHAVYLDAYCIQRHEVTRDEYLAYIAAKGLQAPMWGEKMGKDTRKLPANGVLWEDARDYCQWAGMRLPSEVEWEKAARGTDGRQYPWGDEWDITKANTIESGLEQPLPVGSYRDGASPYGLLDMTGNVAEWVSDAFDFDYYKIAPDHNPTGPDKILDHGLRGGSFASPANMATTYFRDSSHSALPNPRAGFRCASDPDK